MWWWEEAFAEAGAADAGAVLEGSGVAEGAGEDTEERSRDEVDSEGDWGSVAIGGVDGWDGS